LKPVKALQQFSLCENILYSKRIYQNVLYWRSKTLLFRSRKQFLNLDGYILFTIIWKNANFVDSGSYILIKNFYIIELHIPDMGG
jgi:hypothetical protein